MQIMTVVLLKFHSSLWGQVDKIGKDYGAGYGLALHRREAITWTNDDKVHWLIYMTPGFNVHDDVIKWKHFPRYWPFVRGIHRSPVNSPHKGQWREALMFSLIYVWINGWVNNRKAGDLRRYSDHYDVIVMV